MLGFILRLVLYPPVLTDAQPLPVDGVARLRSAAAVLAAAEAQGDCTLHSDVSLTGGLASGALYARHPVLNVSRLFLRHLPSSAHLQPLLQVLPKLDAAILVNPDGGVAWLRRAPSKVDPALVLHAGPRWQRRALAGAAEVLFDSCLPSFILFLVALPDDSRLALLSSIGELEISRCEDSPIPALRNTHGCLNHTKCTFNGTTDRLSVDAYDCCCSEGRCVEAANFNDSTALAACFPAESSALLRQALVGVNGVCAIGALCLVLVVMSQRKVEELSSRGWALMELWLLGAVLEYGVAGALALPPGPVPCCLAVWLRELGFVAFYASLVLKIYRNLMEYRVRKASSMYVKEIEMVKWVGLGLVLTITGLIGWTAAAAQREPGRFVGTGMDKFDRPYPVCRLEFWATAWHVYEVLFLSYGLLLSYKARNTTWIERWQFTAAVGLEFVVTLSCNLARYVVWYETSTDAGFLLNFVQTHLTITVNILLIMVPKLHYQLLIRRWRAGRHRSSASLKLYNVSGSESVEGGIVVGVGGGARAHPSLARLRDNLLNGTVDFAEIPIAEMNPEDIRAELKRVYTQLRMFKLKNAYSDNPHLSKRKAKPRPSDKPSRRRISLNTPSQSTRLKDLKREEEVSSVVRSVGEWDEAAGGASSVCATEALASDQSIVSSPHNLCLLTNADELNSISPRYKLQSDHSVRV